MILMKENNLEILFGTKVPLCRPERIYRMETIEFLDAFSRAIRADGDARQYPEIMTFAFWIRKAHISQMMKAGNSVYRRVGKGTVFHIAPSNVPINFAYTFVFGLLAGNSNIVKISSRKFEQNLLLCKILENVCREPEFSWVAERNTILLYPREETQWTDFYSDICDARVVWGGDETISAIRKSPLPPRSTEVTFADRYSCALMDAEQILTDTPEDLKNLCRGFYNDTYLMDQNACSSPHLIFLKGDAQKCQKASEIFWTQLYHEAQKYVLEDAKVTEKYLQLHKALAVSDITAVQKFENVLYVLRLHALPGDICDLRGKFGLFYELFVNDENEIIPFLGKKVQTCATHGIERKVFAEKIAENGIRGVDRIVDVGDTLDMSIVWDGCNVVEQLSRIIWTES